MKKYFITICLVIVTSLVIGCGGNRNKMVHVSAIANGKYVKDTPMFQNDYNLNIFCAVNYYRLYEFAMTPAEIITPRGVEFAEAMKWGGEVYMARALKMGELLGKSNYEVANDFNGFALVSNKKENESRMNTLFQGKCERFRK